MLIPRKISLFCLLLMTGSAYSQALESKVLGKWACVSRTLVSEVPEEKIVWNKQNPAYKDYFSFGDNGQFGRSPKDESIVFSPNTSFSMQDSLLIITGDITITKFRIEKLTDDSLQLLQLNMVSVKSSRDEESIIHYRFAFQRLPATTTENSNTQEMVGENSARVVEDKPIFPGGSDALRDFLGAKLRYPKAALRSGVEGTVWASFVVSANGEIIDGEIASSSRMDFAVEVARILKLTPRWIPGKQNGKSVPVSFTLPVKFTL
ncbi:MAG: energy transducer TonB [Bacteroidota bacterium]